MWGEVDRTRIEAPGFDYDEFLRQAYCNAEHIGNQRPDIDPLKSVSANILEQKYAYSTGHKITSERGGGDYQENLTIIKKEFEKLAEAIAPMQPDSADALPTNSRAPEEPE
jgi:capsid protein